MYYYFDDKINTENINNLIERTSTEEGEINLWFSTSGGETSAIKFFIRYANTIKDRLIITLTDICWSAGTELLINFEGKIVIDKSLDSILFHLYDRESYNHRKDSSVCNEKILAKQDLKENLKIAAKIKQKELLTDKQIEKFLKGKDVVVYQKQFRKWKLNK